MLRKRIIGGLVAAFLLFFVAASPLIAGGKQEKAESEDDSQQKSEQSTEKSSSGQKMGNGETSIETSSQGAAADQNDGPAAVVNGQEISMAKFNRFLQMQQMEYMRRGQQLQQSQLQELRSRTLDYLIDQEVLFQQAKAEGISADEEKVEKQLQQYKQQSGGESQFKQALAQQGMSEKQLETDVRKQLILQKFIQNEFESDISISDEEARDFYKKNPDYFTQKEQVKTQHIIIQVKEDAAEAKVTEARKKIEKVQEQLEKGVDFAELAKQFSEGPSSKNGGSLGFVQRGQMVPTFEKTAFSLDPGEVSDIIRTQFGFHIVKVTDRKEEETSPYEEVKSDIINHLKTVKMDEKVQNFLEKKKGNMDIERNIAG